MRYIGIDLHKRVLVVAVEGGSSRRPALHTFSCRDVDAVRTFFEAQRPFRAVIEASSSYRWLYELLAPLGESSWRTRCGCERSRPAGRRRTNWMPVSSRGFCEVSSSRLP